MTDDELMHLPLNQAHLAAEATMGTEANWSVPLSYAGPLHEAREAATRAAVFDLSHLGRLRIRGDGGLELLERVCTHDVARQDDNTARPTLLCNGHGGVLASGILVRLESYWVLTVEAGNREKVLAHLVAQAVDDARVDDQTDKVCQFNIVGPQGEAILDAVLPVSMAGMQRGAVKTGSLMIARYIALRTGCTARWSIEVLVPMMLASQAWRFITIKAGENDIPPAGMACRDILRLEGGLCRYGHELSEAIDPVSAGLTDRLSFDHDFLGADALAKLVERGPTRQRVLLHIDPPGELERLAGMVPRQGEAVFNGEAEIGSITSAAYSPNVQTILAMAYVAAGSADADQPVTVARDGQTLAGRCVQTFGR